MIATMAVCGLLAGCGVGKDSPDEHSGNTAVPRDELRVVGEDPRIIVAKLTSYTTAYLPGTLGYAPSARCLFLTHAEPQGRRSTPLWPAGTTPITFQGKKGVQVPGTGRILVGDRVVANGEFSTDAATAGTADMPPCGTEPEGFTTIDPHDPTGKQQRTGS